jgi:1,4-dihydroxy-6-naphthoate synthase
MIQMSTRIQLGISTCPNDTFSFHGILSGAVDTRGLTFDVELLDIEELNQGLFAGKFDVAKTSFHAALKLARETVVLRVGSALGFGVGPLLLASNSGTIPSQQTQLTLCPGENTTAALLFELFYPQTTRVEQAVFSEIMPRLVRHQADFGVCIHEGRFTWQDQGLALVEDLGTRWETETQSPLPLGGLVARRSLGTETIRLVESVILESILYGLRNRDAAIPTMRRYAQEFDDDVLMKHVELYVNDWTCDLGSIGRAALDTLSLRSRKLDSMMNLSDLEIFSA